MRNVTTPRGPTSVWLPQCVMSGLDYKKWNLPGGNVECHTGNGTWAKLSALSSAARSAHFHLLCDIHRTHPVEGPLPVLMKALSPLILTTPPNRDHTQRVCFALKSLFYYILVNNPDERSAVVSLTRISHAGVSQLLFGSSFAKCDGEKRPDR